MTDLSKSSTNFSFYTVNKQLAPAPAEKKPKKPKKNKLFLNWDSSLQGNYYYSLQGGIFLYFKHDI